MAILHWRHGFAGIESLSSTLGRRRSTATAGFPAGRSCALGVAGLLIGCALIILASSTSSHAETNISPLEPLDKPLSVSSVRSQIAGIKDSVALGFKVWTISSEHKDGSVDYRETAKSHSITEKRDGTIVESKFVDTKVGSLTFQSDNTYIYATDGTVTAQSRLPSFNPGPGYFRETIWSPDGTVTTTGEALGRNKTTVSKPDGSSTTTQTEPAKIPFQQKLGTSTTVLVKHPDGSTTTTVTITDENRKLISTDTTSAPPPTVHSIVGELGTGTSPPPANAAAGGGGPPSTGGSAGRPPNATPPAGPTVAVLPPPPAATACPACEAIAGRIEDVDKQIEVTDGKIAGWQRQDQMLRTNFNPKAPATKKSLGEIAKDTADLKAQRAQLVAKREQLEAQRAACETQCIPPPQNQSPPPPTSTNAEPTNSGPPSGQPQSVSGNSGFQFGFGSFGFGSGGSNQGSFGGSNQQSRSGQQQSGRGNGQQR